MEVYKSVYWAILYDKETHLLTPIWNSTSADMTEESYKSEMENYVELVEKYEPKQLLIDCQEFYFPIAPHIQEWIDATIFPRVLAVGVKHVAIVVPSEIIANISVQQAMEEPKGTKFVTRYFDKRTDANQWLLSVS
ncbi:MAG: hypothetical protein EAZ95_11465 [Bacteroidetes bacterium]|nr:MAG: hypothetical protein EAZ95_11465 [Bacteroidota bacterium]